MRGRTLVVFGVHESWQEKKDIDLRPGLFVVECDFYLTKNDRSSSATYINYYPRISLCDGVLRRLSFRFSWEPLRR